ncbi:ATP-grasp domain-containing protein [Pseudooceanicola antarcticus]|uniref:ATP-grasp domain-containing protein n=1 Tax=Pseudooceanicola antarcticus TaxID=1247613 RepID=A0A285HZU8_9RHOB|nr:ATP-grasp domain-containing protein [Pseudooceanicola antarcticus]PJE30302.1 hypothetical protein CVM39_06215 [Pseudooceanicola antarcticus]SNY41229.1 ATP-grasp domain-containing protein [Pseudooceanicola antarcticus]
MILLTSGQRRGRSLDMQRHLAPLGVTLDARGFSSDLVADADALLPTEGAEICYLNTVYPELSGKKYLAPDPATYRLCEDKRALVEHLAEAGFGAYLPLPREDAPVLRKPRIGTGGKHATECSFDEVGQGDQWAWQRRVETDSEYAAHMLVDAAGEIRMARQVRYAHRPGLIRRGLRDGQGQVQALPQAHAAVFAAMLRHIGFRGFCCIDYFVEEGAPLVLEINGRIGASLMRMAGPMAQAYLQALDPAATAAWPAPVWPAQVRQNVRLRDRLARLRRHQPAGQPV